jgi:hypothetical protein
MTDDESVHEVECPNCSAVIRARMADAAEGRARVLLAELVAQWDDERIRLDNVGDDWNEVGVRLGRQRAALKARVREELGLPGPVEIREEDLRVDVYRNGSPMPQRSTVQVTHLPTGIVTTAEDWSQVRAKERAIQELRARLWYDSRNV